MCWKQACPNDDVILFRDFFFLILKLKCSTGFSVCFASAISCRKLLCHVIIDLCRLTNWSEEAVDVFGSREILLAVVFEPYSFSIQPVCPHHPCFCISCLLSVRSVCCPAQHHVWPTICQTIGAHFFWKFCHQAPLFITANQFEAQFRTTNYLRVTLTFSEQYVSANKLWEEYATTSERPA